MGALFSSSGFDKIQSIVSSKSKRRYGIEPAHPNGFQWEKSMIASITPGVTAPKLQRQLRDWAEDKRGVAAIEFAMIAIPFFFLLFGLLEVCAIFIFTTVLEHGLNEASRSIRTGQAQEAGLSEVTFKDSVCAELFELLDCGGNLSIDVQTFSNFGSTSSPTPIDDSGDFDPSGFGFNPGAQNEIVVVRAFYEWQLFTPVMSAPLSNLNGGKRLIQSTIAFRNEPFGTT